MVGKGEMIRDINGYAFYCDLPVKDLYTNVQLFCTESTDFTICARSYAGEAEQSCSACIDSFRLLRRSSCN